MDGVKKIYLMTGPRGMCGLMWGYSAKRALRAFFHVCKPSFKGPYAATRVEIIGDPRPDVITWRVGDDNATGENPNVSS